MGLANVVTEISSSLNLCQTLNCGGTANRLKITIKGQKKDAYFACYLNTQNHFHGRCTWGSSGFDFEIWISVSTGSPQVMFKSKTANNIVSHSDMDGALEKFIKHLEKRLRVKSTNKKGGGRFKAPQLEARKAGVYQLPTTANRINHWVQQGVFDTQFGLFIKNNVNQGFRCKGT